MTSLALARPLRGLVEHHAGTAPAKTKPAQGKKAKFVKAGHGRM